MKNNLRDIRTREDLTMAALAESVGTNLSLIQTLEKQKGAAPRLDMAYAIAAVLGAEVSDIWPDDTEIIERTIVIKRVKKAPKSGAENTQAAKTAEQEPLNNEE